MLKIEGERKYCCTEGHEHNVATESDKGKIEQAVSSSNSIKEKEQEYHKFNI